jgi:hypothetical protein
MTISGLYFGKKLTFATYLVNFLKHQVGRKVAKKFEFKKNFL